MIYVPMFKNRQVELSVINGMNNYFNDKMIPLIEIINDIFKRNNNEEKITLKKISEKLNGKIAFIDFFRFNSKKYKQFTLADVRLAWDLSNNKELYKRRIEEIGLYYDNFIPTLSFKKDIEDFRINELIDFLNQIQNTTKSVAIRITENWINKYINIFEKNLRETDYLLFDIEEQNVVSKIMELNEVMQIKTKAKKILLNSPRKASKNNNEYEINGITSLIDNSVRDEYKKYGFQGFGDYCGLKDVLPYNIPTGGKGTALALLYDYKINSFYSFLNDDTNKREKGFLDTIPWILEKSKILDPYNNCPAFKKIINLNGSSGGYKLWKNIIATRYIDQISRNL